MQDHWLIILNPTADRGRARDAVPEIRRTLEAKGISFELLVTPSTEVAGMRVLEQAHTASMIVAAGGDGTVHAAVNALMQAKENHGIIPKATLGVIPIGTGNDFAKMLGLSKNLGDSLNTLMNHDRKTADIARISNDDSPDRFFSNNVGVGFDAFANYKSKQIRYLRGVALYYAAVLNSVFQYKHSEMHIQIGGESIKRKILMVTAGNGACSGGGFYITPEARIDDGMLDVCVIDSRARIQMLLDLPKVTKGSHEKVKGVLMTRATELTITSETPMPIHADGEVISMNARQITMKIFSAALYAAWARR